MPVPLGRLSEKVMPVAVPTPALVILTLKPICSPALTEAASAVFWSR